RSATAPVLVEAPQKACYPGHAALDDHDFLAWKALQNTMAEDRRKMAHVRRAQQGMVLIVEIRHAGRGHRCSCDAHALIVDVDGHCQPHFVRGFPQWVVKRIAVGNARSSGEDDLDNVVTTA